MVEKAPVRTRTVWDALSCSLMDLGKSALETPVTLVNWVSITFVTLIG